MFKKKEYGLIDNSLHLHRVLLDRYGQHTMKTNDKYDDVWDVYMGNELVCHVKEYVNKGFFGHESITYNIYRKGEFVA